MQTEPVIPAWLQNLSPTAEHMWLVLGLRGARLVVGDTQVGVAWCSWDGVVAGSTGGMRQGAARVGGVCLLGLDVLQGE